MHAIMNGRFLTGQCKQWKAIKKMSFLLPISPICVTLTNELFNFFVTITKVIGSLKRENNMEMHITICRVGYR